MIARIPIILLRRSADSETRKKMNRGQIIGLNTNKDEIDAGMTKRIYIISGRMYMILGGGGGGGEEGIVGGIIG